VFEGEGEPGKRRNFAKGKKDSGVCGAEKSVHPSASTGATPKIGVVKQAPFLSGRTTKPGLGEGRDRTPPASILKIQKMSQTRG